jgi:hypothetical protein
MLRHAHFYIKGGNRTFAALCIEVSYADFADLGVFDANWCFGPKAAAHRNHISCGAVSPKRTFTLCLRFGMLDAFWCPTSALRKPRRSSSSLSQYECEHIRAMCHPKNLGSLNDRKDTV